MRFDEIEITYATSDRFGASQGGDPHQRHVQYVHGTITESSGKTVTTTKTTHAELAVLEELVRTKEDR